MSVIERERVSENDLERSLDGVSERVVHLFNPFTPERTNCGLPRGTSKHEGCPAHGITIAPGSRYCSGCGRPYCAFCLLEAGWV